MSSMARVWSRTLALGRDSITLGGALVQAARRRQSPMGDAFQNALVSQARLSNQIATSLLSLQHKWGLIRYHGLLEYFRNHRPLKGSPPPLLMDTPGANGTPAFGSGNGGGAKVAFMITTSMRKQLSEQLEYTAEQIKAMTPVEASLVLQNQVMPIDRERVLPGLLETHRVEQEKVQQERALLEEQQRLAQQKAIAIPQEEAAVGEPHVVHEGLTKGDEPKTLHPLDSRLDSSLGWGNDASGTTRDGLVGSFVKSMQENKVRVEKEWFEVIETRTDGNGEDVPVALFSTEEEANIVANLKGQFAERRAKEEKDNTDNVPATTYRVQKTLK